MLVPLRRVGAAETAASSTLAAAWYGVAVLLAAYTLAFIDRTILSLLVEPLKRTFAISDSQFSLLHGLAFAVFYTTLGIPIARWADQGSRQRIVACGIVLWSAMTAACGFAQSYLQLFLARVGVGSGEAALSPASYSMIHDWFPRERLGRALSTYSTGVCLGGGLALLIGGAAVQWVMTSTTHTLPVFGPVPSLRLVFLTVGLPGVLLALLVLMTVGEPRRQHGSAGGRTSGRVSGASAADFRRFVTVNRATLGYHFVGFSLNGLMLMAYLAWAPTLYVRKFGHSASQAALPLGLALLVCGTAGMISGGALADRFTRRGRPDSFILAALVGSLGLIPSALAAALAPGPGSTTAAFCAFFFFVSFSIGLGPASLQVLAPTTLRAQVSALYICFLNILATAVGPTAVAVCTDYLFRRPSAIDMSMAVVAVAVCPLSAVMFALCRKPFARYVCRASDNPLHSLRAAVAIAT